MTLDRIDTTAFAVAVIGHLALLALLKLAMDDPPAPPPLPASMEVSFVEEAALQSSAPAALPSAAAAEPTTEPPPPADAPIPEPAPRASGDPVPLPRPTPARPAPERPAQRAERPAPQPARRRPLSESDFAPFGSDPSPSRTGAPAAAVMNAQAQANIASAILRQVQPCADRQRSPGPGAERIRVTIRLRLNRNGSLVSRPTVVGRTGVNDTNSRYAERVDDLAINTFTACAPLRGLPAELYDVPNGWRDFRLRYNLPG